jgi:hypothetical protein
MPPDSPRVVSLLSGMCLLLAVALPALVLYYLVVSPAQVLGERLGIPPESVPVELAAWQRVIVVALGTLPVLCLAFGLTRARRCFQSFARHEYFTLGVVQGLRGLAVGVFLSGALGLLAAPLSSAVVALSAAPGQRSIALSLDSTNLLTMLFAGLVWQISAVMAKAVTLAEENSQFV